MRIDEDRQGGQTRRTDKEDRQVGQTSRIDKEDRERKKDKEDGRC